MPQPIKSGFQVVSPEISLAQILAEVEDNRQILVVPVRDNRFACLLRADLEALASHLLEEDLDPDAVPLGRLAKNIAVAGVGPEVSRGELQDLLREQQPLYGMLVACGADGTVSGLLINAAARRKLGAANPEIVARFRQYLSGARAEEAPTMDRRAWDSPASGRPRRPGFSFGLPGENETPSAGAEAEPTAQPKIARRVQAQVYLEDAAGPVRLTRALALGKPHSLEVWIGAPEVDALTAGQDFPEDRLPPGQAQYELSIYFSEPNHFPRPVKGSLTLPAGSGESTHCKLSFTTRPDVKVFCGRLQISFQERAIQTLLLTGRVMDDPGASADQTLELTVEAELAAGLDNLEAVQGFQVTLVKEASGLNIFAGGDPDFIEISGEDARIQHLVDQLGKIARFPNNYTALRSAATVKLLRNLAMHGLELYELLADEIGADHPLFQPETTRIQLLSASDEVFPIETLYIFSDPLDPEAELCPNAENALKTGVCEHCAQLDRAAARRTICPVRFLGLSRVIERQKISGKMLKEIKAGQPPNPGGDDQELAPLRSVVHAQSAKIESSDIQALVEAIHLQVPNAVQPADWTAWREAVSQHAPTLLLVMPHTLIRDDFMNLEIDKAQDLPVNSISEEYVRAQPDLHPLVVVLGCSTAIQSVPYEGVTAAFRRGGAAATITTLTEVRGRHVVPIAKILLSELKAAAGQCSFGEALLRTRQQALAAGYPAVLALVSDGNIDWKITN